MQETKLKFTGLDSGATAELCGEIARYTTATAHVMHDEKIPTSGVFSLKAANARALQFALSYVTGHARYGRHFTEQ